MKQEKKNKAKNRGKVRQKKKIKINTTIHETIENRNVTEDQVCTNEDTINLVNKTRVKKTKSSKTPVGDCDFVLKDCDRQKEKTQMKIHTSEDINKIASLLACPKSRHKFVAYDILKPCLYCAGDHVEDACEEVICNFCGKKGHLWKHCTTKHRTKMSLCQKCTHSSHTKLDCPRGYRKYKVKQCVQLQNIVKSCGMCGGDHFSDDCLSSLETNRFSVFSTKFIEYINKKFYK